MNRILSVCCAGRVGVCIIFCQEYVRPQGAVLLNRLVKCVQLHRSEECIIYHPPLVDVRCNPPFLRRSNPQKRCHAKQSAADPRPPNSGQRLVHWLTSGSEEILEFPMAKQDVPAQVGEGTD